MGTLKGDDEIVVNKGTVSLSEFDAHLIERHQQVLDKNKKKLFKPVTIKYKGEEETYYSYCNTHRIKSFGRLRLVISHNKEDLSDTPTFFISNRKKWRAQGITRIRRHRCPVEVYHEEGKADGLDQYQVRSFEAIGKHIALVSVTYSLLRAAQHDTALVHKLRRNVHTVMEGSAGACRRNTQAQALWVLACFIQTALAQGQMLDDIMKPILFQVRLYSMKTGMGSGENVYHPHQRSFGETHGLSHARPRPFDHPLHKRNLLKCRHRQHHKRRQVQPLPECKRIATRNLRNK